MTRREGLLLLLTGVAAFAAALTLRVAALPGEIHDPDYADAFEGARENLPMLGAVRVRSSIDGAAVRLDSARGPLIERVLDPALAGAEYRYQRYLYATPEQIRSVRESLERGLYPGPPPPVPDLSRFFRDARGPYRCDVIVRDARALDRIREVLPGAELSGEPVRREGERAAAATLPRSLILGLVAAALALWRTRGRAEAVGGLVRAMFALATLCLVGWGVDRWTLPALLLVALAPPQRAFLLGLPCLLSPALALKRLGLVLLFGTLGGRWGGAGGRSEAKSPPDDPAGARGRSEAKSPPDDPAGAGGLARYPMSRGPLVAALVVAAFALHLRSAPPAGSDEPVVRLVPRAERHAIAAAIPADVAYEDATILPPAVATEERRSIDKIFQLASHLARAAAEGEAARWQEIVEAASKSDPYLPTALRERLVARDGRAAIWNPGGWRPPSGDPASAEGDWLSARLSRARGERALIHDARIAALAAFAVAAALSKRLLLLTVGLGGGAAILIAWPGGEPLLPLVVVAAASRGGWTLPFVFLLASLAGPLPPVLPWAAALLVALVLGALSRR